MAFKTNFKWLHLHFADQSNFKYIYNILKNNEFYFGILFLKQKQIRFLEVTHISAL